MRNESMRLARTLLTLGLALGAAGTALAHESAGEESVQPVMREALPDAPGKQVALVTVAYAPGQASTPHSHPGPVFAYVLEGSVVSQLAGEAPRTYTQGQSWYEPPGAHHVVSRNGSATQPARLLAWLIGGEREALKQPLPR